MDQLSTLHNHACRFCSSQRPCLSRSLGTVGITPSCMLYMWSVQRTWCNFVYFWVEIRPCSSPDQSVWEIHGRWWNVTLNPTENLIVFFFLTWQKGITWIFFPSPRSFFLPTNHSLNLIAGKTFALVGFDVSCLVSPFDLCSIFVGEIAE